MRSASVLACLLAPGLVWAAPPANTEEKPAETTRKALDQPVTLRIDKQTLAAAVEALAKQTKINIVLDVPVIQQQLGFTPDQSNILVQLDAGNVKARTALRSILESYNLSYVVLDDTVLVTSEDMAVVRQMRQRVSVDLSKVDLAAAMRQIGRETAANVVVDARAEKEAKVEVTLRLEDVPLETAVRLLAEMAGLKPVRVGNTLFVTRKEIAAEMRNDPDFAQQNPAISNAYAAPNGASVSIINGQVFANAAGGTPIAPAPVPAPNPPVNGPGVAAPPAAVPGPATGTTTPPNPRLGEPDVQERR